MPLFAPSAPVDLSPLEARIAALESSPSGWSAIDIGTGIALSNKDQTAAWIAGSGRSQVAGAKIHNAGAWYFEVAIRNRISTFLAVGIGQPSGQRDVDLGQNAGDYGYDSGGSHYMAGSFLSSPSYPAFTSGNVIGVALDLAANTIRWYKNNVPVAAAVPIAAGGYVIGACFSAQYEACTVRTVESQFSYAVPAGFSAWG